ncbi:MAG TPA: response regulator [Rectinemataceae bacterium]|nr:response regulator [Rectinemataceae bacterium]
MDVVQEIEVLLVEDNPQDADLAKRAFKKKNLANHLHWVEDGEEALDFLFRRGRYADRSQSRNPKVVMLDLKLPKVDGLEVLEAIKKDERTKSIPVVIVTSSRQDPDIARAYALGANSYVVKPIDFDQFAEAMINLGYYWLLINQPPAERS